MRSHLTVLPVAASLAAVLTVAVPAAAAQPWTELAVQDLTEVHRLVSANHPGPADPHNPGYRIWHEEGFAQARARAAQARSFADYKRVLQFYANGFRDGHMAVYFTVDAVESNWPGFLPRARPDGGLEVGVSEEAAVPVGARIIACDGRPAEHWVSERVAPYFWNRDIPHALANGVPRLMVTDRGDGAFQFKSCDLEIGGVRSAVDLSWRRVERSRVADLRRAALGRVTPPQGLRKVGDVWMLSLPTFGIYPGPDTDAFRALLAELSAKAPALRRSTLVIDVRGNGGGNSDWGAEIARTIWGEAWVSRIGGAFDNTVDWRASPDNLKSLEDNLARSRAQNLADGIRYYAAAVTAVKAAMARGEALARQAEPGAPAGPPEPANPVTGRVYFLTDGACFSACLDFADIVRRMPGVTHVGLPTSADAIYIDNTAAALPSGLAGLSYSLKVYRNRVRGNNEWYRP